MELIIFLICMPTLLGPDFREKTCFFLLHQTGHGCSRHQCQEDCSVSSLRLRSRGTGRIFDQWKIRAFRRFVHMEPRQTYENLNAQAFKNLNVKIEVEFLAGAVNNLTATVCGLGSILFTRRR